MAERIIKPWGWSQEVYRDELTRVVRIHVEPGGFCSWHRHDRQINTFHVIRGDLRLFYEDGTCQVGDKNPCRILSIQSRTEHQFENESSSPVEALEIYTSTDGSPPDESDIVRFNEGGIRSPSS